MQEKHLDWIKWFRLLILILVGGTVFKIAFMKDVFYVPMQEAYGLTHLQIGTMLSVYTIVATSCYLVGGWVADRYKSKYLISSSMVAIGGVGLYLASAEPGYEVFLAVWAVLGLLCDCVVWAALLKGVRHVGEADEQGRMFGFLETGRGVVDTIIAFSALAIFAFAGEGVEGMKAAIIFYSVLDIVVGVLAFIFLTDGESKSGEKVSNENAKETTQGWIATLKDPSMWLVAINVFSVYIVYCGLTYFIPYMKEIYMLPVALVGVFGIINQYALKMFGGVAGGFAADKIFKSAAKYIRFSFIVIIVMMVILMMTPVGADYMYLGLIVTLLYSFVIYTMRATFFAPVEEIKMPRKQSGSAMAVASFIGYAPGLFIYIVFGNMLDANPGIEGYNMVFGTMIALSGVGFLVAHTLCKVIAKKNKQEIEVEVSLA